MNKTGFDYQFSKVTYLNFSDVYSGVSHKKSIGIRLNQFLEICYKHSCGAIEGCFLDNINQNSFEHQKRH